MAVLEQCLLNRNKNARNTFYPHRYCYSRILTASKPFMDIWYCTKIIILVITASSDLQSSSLPRLKKFHSSFVPSRVFPPIWIQYQNWIQVWTNEFRIVQFNRDNSIWSRTRQHWSSYSKYSYVILNHVSYNVPISFEYLLCYCLKSKFLNFSCFSSTLWPYVEPWYRCDLFVQFTHQCVNILFELSVKKLEFECVLHQVQQVCY